MTNKCDEIPTKLVYLVRIKGKGRYFCGKPHNWWLAIAPGKFMCGGAHENSDSLRIRWLEAYKENPYFEYPVRGILHPKKAIMTLALYMRRELF